MMRPFPSAIDDALDTLYEPKSLKSGSGRHRLEICGPSNGRHKIA